MSSSIIITGRGPSAYTWDYPDDVPILAVSGGYNAAPHIDYFATVDKPICYPTWLLESDRIEKIVPARWRRDYSNEWEDSKLWKYWKRYPRITGFAYDELATEPNFTVAGPIAKGIPRRNNSLLWSVQVAAKLGYSRLIFIGCDFLEEDLPPICDKLKEWWPSAQALGIIWENASDVSLFEEWMDPYGAVADLPRSHLAD